MVAPVTVSEKDLRTLLGWSATTAPRLLCNLMRQSLMRQSRVAVQGGAYAIDDQVQRVLEGALAVG